MMAGSRSGLYATACEKSPNKTKIDQWLNEGKSYAWISRQLESNFNEKISDKSIGKYAKYRDEQIDRALMEDPEYQAKIQKANQEITNAVGKFKTINVVNHLAETVEHCAELVGNAKMDEIRIKSIQDLRYVQTTMLEALKLYGDVVMQAQQYEKIEENPDLIRPTVNVQVKNLLVDALGGIDDDERIKLIDRLRAGTRSSD